MRRMTNPVTRRIILSAMAIALVAAAAIPGITRYRMERTLMQADPERIAADPALAIPVLALGHDVYTAHCQVCHGRDGRIGRQPGVPALDDADWLYGTGLVAEIEQVTLHGIRSGDSKGFALADMPAYARARPYAREPIGPLTPGDIRDVVGYLETLQGKTGDPAANARGASVYAGRGGCYDCHGHDAQGDPAIGAPNLRDRIWLYGDGSPDTLFRSIAYGHAGRSPAFAHVLSAAQARAVAVYVARLDSRDHS